MKTATNLFLLEFESTVFVQEHNKQQFNILSNEVDISKGL